MNKIVLNNKIELSIVSIVDNMATLEITFNQGTSYSTISSIYDSFENPNFSKEALRRMEIYNESGELQGVHLGYTETQDISSFNGVVKVKIKQEDPLKTEVELLKHQNEILNGAISELTMIVATMSTTK